MKKIWKGFVLFNNLIKAQTEKAVLIQLPSSSRYKGFSFWHPKKLVKSGNMAMVLYTDDFEFRLKKYGKGRFNNREVIDEIILDAETLVESFSMMSETNEISLHHVPQRLEPVATTALQELVDEE